MKSLTEEELRIAKKLASLFLINGTRADLQMSQGQLEIFASVALKVNPRVACLAPTGYGKSESVSMGAIIRAALYGESFILASVKFGTADIIMKMIIDHIFDSPDFVERLEIEGKQDFEELKRRIRRNHLTFNTMGEIKVVSLHGSDENVSLAIGEHAPNVILDESPLLTATKYSQVKKIMEGTGHYKNTFLFELGNAVNRNHFMYNVLDNPDYYKIKISLEQAIQEGRLDQKSVDEQRNMPLFSEFYECKFPEEGEIDGKGFRQLLTREQIQNAFTDEPWTSNGELKLGVDVAGGGDYNVYTIRDNKYAWFDGDNRSNDTMTNVVEVEDRIAQMAINPSFVFLDDIGIGRGVSDRLKEKGCDITSVSVGSKPKDEKRFSNIKAENYWEVKLWIEGGGKLKPSEKWFQLCDIRYKINTDKVIGIEPKQDLKERTGHSPDFAESFMLTFTKINVISWVPVVPEKPTDIGIMTTIPNALRDPEKLKDLEHQEDLRLMKEAELQRRNQRY